MKPNTYILATPKNWHIEAFANRRSELVGSWVLCTSSEDVEAMVAQLAPRYVFFPHWSQIVPDAILEATECVCFHMTDLPYGRGGSPLQNLILRGHLETQLTALRMTNVLDGGPVYTKRALSLEGTAQEIFERSALVTIDIIRWMVEAEPVPEPQEGSPTHFERRRPDESRIPDEADLRVLYDHIRMLDAQGYPHAFIDHGRWRISFTAAEPGEGRLAARAEFALRESPRKDESHE